MKKLSILFLIMLLGLCIDSCKEKHQEPQIGDKPDPNYVVNKFTSKIFASDKTNAFAITKDSLANTFIIFQKSKQAGSSPSSLARITYINNSDVVLSVELSETTKMPISYTLRSSKYNFEYQAKVLDISLTSNKIKYEIYDLSSNKKVVPAMEVDISSENAHNVKYVKSILDKSNFNGRIQAVSCEQLAKAIVVAKGAKCVGGIIFNALTWERFLLFSSSGYGPTWLYEGCVDALDRVEHWDKTECSEFDKDASPAVDCVIQVLSWGRGAAPGCMNTDLLHPDDHTYRNGYPAHGTADPHLMTHDGLPFDFQGRGEFVAAKSKTDNFEIQVRQEDVYKTGRVTMNTGIAIQTGSDVVCITVKPHRLFINKQGQDLTNLSVLLLKDGASVTKTNENGRDVFNISHKNGDLLKVVLQGADYLDYYLYLSENRKSQVIGLLGNYDGDKNNDVQLRNGENLLNDGSLAFSKLYPAYADSWRITQSNSLFYYEPGKNSDTYTEKDFPRTAQTLSPDQKVKAEAICRAAGVTSEPFLSNCIVDVAITNNPDAAQSSVWAQQVDKRIPDAPVTIVFEAVDVKTIEVFEERSFVLKTDGTLWASGENQNGEFGNGQPTAYETKNKFIKIMDGIKDIAKGEGFHMLFLRNDNTVWAAGNNSSGQLGNGTTGGTVLTAIKIMTDAKALAIGRSFSLVLKNDNTLWAFGDNLNGSLGDGTATSRNVPVKIMTDVSAISAGRDHALVLKTDNSLWGFGGNFYGALGISKTTLIVKTPQKLMDGVKRMFAGIFNSMIIKNDNSLWVSGRNNFGQLGNGNKSDLFEFKKVMDNVISAVGTYDCSLFIKTDNSLWGTGDNLGGNLGRDTNEAVSIPVKIQTNVRYVATGFGGTFIAKTDNTIWATGGNAAGQLGSVTYNSGYPYGGLSFFQINVK